jgi:GrpB-like predicted nucleotidyltransferase (UPF0157 family)
MLGLRYGTVALVDYTAEWSSAFVEERVRLAAALSHEPCEIEHIGSTAVPGLVAKPILDIGMATTSAVRVETITPALERLGYVYRGDAGSAGGHVFVAEITQLVRTHHVHVVWRNDPQWDAYLTFRDFLRATPAAVEAYAREKRALAARFPSNRKAYSLAKGEIIRRLFAGAQASRS